MPRGEPRPRSVEALMQTFTSHTLVDDASGLPYTSSYAGDLYDWEFFYDAIVGTKLSITDPVVGGFRLFLQSQRADGFIPRHLRLESRDKVDEYPDEATEHCKPFLAQSALALSAHRQTTAWLLPGELAQLETYLRHWLFERDLRGSGLSVWRSAPHSGADTQVYRAGGWATDRSEGADLNAYLVRECEALAELASLAGDDRRARTAEGWGHDRRRAMQAELWNAKEGFFLDRDAKTSAWIDVKTAAGFLPLWAGVATSDQARQLVTLHLTNPAEFWTPFPICSLARSEPWYTQEYVPKDTPDYPAFLKEGHANWNGGLWPHWQYLIVEGLARYGFSDLSATLSNTLANVVATAGPREWYDAESGRGHGLDPFWAGASLVGELLGRSDADVLV